MFSSKKSIRIDKELYTKLQEKSGEAGYSSVEEFIAHVLESAVAGGGDDDLDREQVDRQLRGLGYLD
jgi:hypothetical protein